jgi:hypothetical protein
MIALACYVTNFAVSLVDKRRRAVSNTFTRHLFSDPPAGSFRRTDLFSAAVMD